MNIKLKTLSFALGISAVSFAQVSMPSTNETKTITNQAPASLSAPNTSALPTSKEGIGNLIGTMTNNISSSSLTDAFAKSKPEFVNKANSTTTPSAASGLLQNLAGGLKPSSFTSGWAGTKAKWMAIAKSATTLKQVAGLLSQLESKIDPKSFKGEWAKLRPMWEAGLNKLSK